MTRVPFGVTCSPFILAATIKYHIKKYKQEKPDAVNMLNSSLYVDDLFFGSSSITEAYSLSSDAVQILQDAGMNLTKFKTNSDELRSLWVENDIITNEISEENNLKVLGIIWDNVNDILKLEMHSLLESLKSLRDTKRNVLKTAAKIFDPAGFISPFVIRIKCLFQELWIKGLEWDEELPDELAEEWNRWRSEIETFKALSIDRRYFKRHAIDEKIQLHIFCDANPKAYGAVAYFRCEEKENRITTSFILSKSRVSPLKKLTLPRLELLSAVIGARLATYLKSLFNIKDSNVYMWSDSSITLHWIKGSARQWKPFVANRVTEIQSLTNPGCWRHCSGKENPADIITRGETAEKLISNMKWWNGASFLMMPEMYWNKIPIEKLSDEEEVLERSEKKSFLEEEAANELRSKLQAAINYTIESKNTNEILDLERHNSITKIYFVTGWMRRFIANSRTSSKTERIMSPLTSEEIAEAEKIWIKKIQNESFCIEIECLLKKKPIPKDSRIRDLNPFLDDCGMLRVGGRLQKSKLEFEAKHPILLPTKHKFTELLVNHTHESVLHSGVNDTLIQIRERFWIVRGRQLVKSVLNKCKRKCL